MAPSERPNLRRFLDAIQTPEEPGHVYLVDRLPFGTPPLRLTLLEFGWLRYFDGRRTPREIQAEAMRQMGGIHVPFEPLARLASRLDDALFLDGVRFRARIEGRVREPACIGCYESDPQALREQLEELFLGAGGPGLPRRVRPEGMLRAALVPHIDYARGGHTYAWGFREIAEQVESALFVIIATSHYSPCRFTLTRRDFKTPLGTVPTDPTAIARLVEYYGDGLFEDEVAHLPEHSIELEIVFLQYLFDSRRPFRIVPLLVGSFQDCVEERGSPSRWSDIARMVEALRRLEAETRAPIFYVISGDLAHVGLKFGDPSLVAEPFLAQSRQQDHAILHAAESTDPDNLFRVIAAEDDRRRICGLPPMWTTLAAAQPKRGKVLHYDQYVHPQGFESVSFASIAFYR